MKQAACYRAMASLLLFIVSCDTTVQGLSKEDLSAIRELHSAIEVSLLDGTWEVAFPGFYEENAVLLEKRMPPVKGRTAIAQRLERWKGLVFRERTHTIEAIEGAGRLAYAWGLIAQSGEFNGTPFEGGLKMLRVFRKQPDGSWLISVEIWNYDEY